MHSVIYPLIWTVLAGILITLVIAVFASRAKNNLRKRLLIAVALMVVPASLMFAVFHPAFADGRFRAYKSFYCDIKVGMTREQVLALLDRHYPANGPRQRPRIWQDDAVFLGLFMNPEGWREPNCEGIFLTLNKGRITKIAYGED